MRDSSRKRNFSIARNRTRTTTRTRMRRDCFPMAKGYKQAEQVIDTERWTTEFFIDTPDGRMSVRMPNFLSNAEQQRRVKVVVEALNGEHAIIGSKSTR